MTRQPGFLQKDFFYKKAKVFAAGKRLYNEYKNNEKAFLRPPKGRSGSLKGSFFDRRNFYNRNNVKKTGAAVTGAVYRSAPEERIEK